jgi:hypothetical protein
MTLDLSKIPHDIIDKYIIPYTYTPQSPELLKDIKTYHYTLTQLFEMYYQVYREHPDGKKGIHRLLKVSVNHYLYEIEKIRNISYIKKFVWQIPLTDDKTISYPQNVGIYITCSKIKMYDALLSIFCHRSRRSHKLILLLIL